ncbi:adenylate/guanylate cyclase domain-containing protein [Mangrovibrevibacter kandeliae]|uniref:adenylate/guanylate cyclase domain-containing protein n=1 Tax=Mangrovibrevibacter kandeliae TaxID=2968473 RepID=UPI002117695A|nr:transcriptional regulator [Aurantimonas sp. CSK15Z-1]
MANNWKHDRAKSAIDARIKDVETVTIVDYKRETSLESIPTNKAYRMDAVHLYVDIQNFEAILSSTEVDGVTAHKRALRFLDLHQRAVHRILQKTDTRRVDFHGQRLHAVVAKPYGESDEATRVHRAVAIAQLVTDVLSETGDDEGKIPNAEVRVGIDTGRALVVNNGRSGYREPLFLGRPANMAAKLASSDGAVGIYLTNDARRAIDLDELDEDDVADTALTADEIDASVEAANLEVSKDAIVKGWRKDNDDYPIGSFVFSRTTPPIRHLDIPSLTPGNSRRMETVSVYADINNFTAYVDAHIDDDPEDVVRCLHVIRAELDRVLTSDFGGRRVRFIGDCVHGHLLEGTAAATNATATVSTGAICAGALRSSFDLALERLADAGVEIDELGLAIGFEFGQTALSRLGVQGSRTRCSIGRTVIGAENEQKRCDGSETAIGKAAYDAGPASVRTLFGVNRLKPGLTYDVVMESLEADNNAAAKAIRAASAVLSTPAAARAAETTFRPYAEDGV